MENLSDQFYELIIDSTLDGLTLENVFKDIFKAPKKLTHNFRMEKSVLVNDNVANWTSSLTRGDIVKVKLFEEKAFLTLPSKLTLEVIFEDEHFLIVNKQPYIKTHPNEEKETNTLANGVSYYLKEKKEFRAVRHVNRLDYETSGLILFAKHDLAGAILDNMLANREIDRKYVAIVHGKPKKSNFSVDAAIGRDRHHPTKRRVSQTGQAALTHFKLLQYFPNKNVSLVQCELITGRTHQIRVHLNHIGHPIVGDELYGKNDNEKTQLLHAAKLQFTHPFNQQIIKSHAVINSIFKTVPVDEINDLILKL